MRRVIEAHGEVEIALPAEAVFDFLADARNEPRWLPGAKTVEQTTAGAIGRGTRFEGVYARAGRVALELVEFERPSRVTFRATSRIVDFDDAVTLSEADGVTRLHATMTAKPRGIMRLFAPAMAKTMRAQFAANWLELRRALETRPELR